MSPDKAQSVSADNNAVDSPLSGPPRSHQERPSKPTFTGSGMRALLYSHDTLGLGHISRTAKICRALKCAYPELSILVVTGSPVSIQARLGDGVDYIKLPSVKKLADERYTSRELKNSFERTLALRSQLILSAVREFEPHVMLVDHAPLGVKGELLPTFSWLAAHDNCTQMALGLRDVLDEPSSVIERWKKQGVYGVLRDTYKRILIYGDANVFNPVIEYEFPQDIAAKTYFCNFVSDRRQAHTQLSENGDRAPEKQSVVVTIGGGDYYGREVIGTYLDALKEFAGKVDFTSEIITGPLIEPALFAELRGKSQGLPVVLHKSVDDIYSLLRNSDLVIATGGYNTTIEALTYANRALIIPRVTMRREQQIRADKLASLGLVSTLHPETLTTKQLFSQIKRQLALSEAPLEKARREKTINLDGAERAAEALGEMLQSAAAKTGRER